MELQSLERFISVFTTLFLVVDPIAAVPMFLALTRGRSTSEIKGITLRASLFGFGLIIGIALGGPSLLRLLGLSLNSLKIAGGLMLLLTALEMLFAQKSSCKCSSTELEDGTNKEDVSFVPIAIPLLAGPGAITSTIVFATDHQSDHFRQFLFICGAAALTFLASYFVLRSSTSLSKLLGPSGLSVTQRLMGILLAAISIQLLTSGITATTP